MCPRVEMLHYPKIPGSRDCPLARCIAFEKLDGTNLHWCWDRDFGWHAFGTRRDRFNLTDAGIAEFTARHEHLAECVELFRTTLADGLDAVFREHPTFVDSQEMTAFTEFLGPNSFAGLHKREDPKEVVLFDVELAGFGMIGPEQFVADFEHLRIPRVLYRGKLTGKFTEELRRGAYGEIEGAVCKGGTGGTDVWMAKVKTDWYLDRLKKAFGEKWEQYWE